MLVEELFKQLSAVIVLSAILAFAAFRLRQPPIIAYLLAGLILAPFLADLGSPQFFGTLAKIGVAFLLFIVGLNLNWRQIRELGWVALATGLGQVIVTSGLGYYLGIALGLNQVTSAYVAVAVAFSSTIVVVKLLSDKDDLETLYGRISVGFLIVQDLLALLVLLLISATRSEGNLTVLLTQAVGVWLLALSVIFAFAHWVLPRIVRYAARSQELLFLFGVAWCFALASVLSLLGFGIEIGALLAGLSLSGIPYSRELSARLRPLRDFFLIVFFIVLGAQLSLETLRMYGLAAVVLTLFVLFIEPIILLVLLRLLGYHPRTGFLVGTTVAQVSEFSFIILVAGVEAGHIPLQAVSLITLVALATIAVNSYMITHNHRLYAVFRPLLRWLEPRQIIEHERKVRPPGTYEVVLIGCHRMGKILLARFRSLGCPYVVIDFNPHIHEELERRRVPHLYGDASDPGFLNDIRLSRAKFIISTPPDASLTRTLLAHLRAKRFRGTVIVTVSSAEEAVDAYAAGATFVVVPSVLSGQRILDFLKKGRLDRRDWLRLAKTASRS